MKTCTLCLKPKALEAFPVKKANKDGRAARCLVCQRALIRSHYENNKDYYKNKAALSNGTANAKRKQYVDKLKSETPCMDCGNKFPPVAMDFDHRDGNEKYKNVSQLLKYSWLKMLAEIDKCDIVCSNCHRVRTQKRLASVT